MKKVVALLLSVVFAIGSAFSASDMYVVSAKSTKKQDAQSKLNKIEEHIKESQKEINKLSKQEKETEKYITALSKDISYQQDKIDALQEKTNALKSQIDAVKAEINNAEKEIESIQKEIDEKQKAFESTYDEYCQRLRAMYVSGHVSNLEVLLSSTDMSSILVRSQMINSVSKQDSKMLEELTIQMEAIEKDKVELEKKRNELNENKASLESDKKELETDLNSIKSEKAALDAKVRECNNLMARISNDKSEYLESIEEDKEEKRKIEAELEAAINNSGSKGQGYLPGGGKLGYPTSYRRISGDYPNYSSGRYHGGVDFPCPVGTPVHASADGTVIVVKRLNRSYGYHFVIDHGNGVSTLCAHNSELLVSVGQKVTKGQVVAKSGSTGNSTGPHVHFEVRVNGKRVNPHNYLG